jgi:5-hydroxyisourate hydrolase
MGKLTTHVLDTMNGCPAGGMSVALYWLEGVRADLLASVTLNPNGRTDAPLLAGPALRPGRYRLVFDVAVYFRGRGVALPDPPFLESVPLEFGVSDSDADWHVPLLVSPWAYSTYRGS